MTTSWNVSTAMQCVYQHKDSAVLSNVAHVQILDGSTNGNLVMTIDNVEDFLLHIPPIEINGNMMGEHVTLPNARPFKVMSATSDAHTITITDGNTWDGANTVAAFSDTYHCPHLEFMVLSNTKIAVINSQGISFS